jgi:hypothetical protein
VELRVQILGADFQRITTTKELPEELEGVIEELGEVFSYQSFQLLETIIIRGIDRYQATTNGSLPINGGIYRFSGRLRVRGAGQAEEVLGLENMQFGMTTPEGNAAINTSLEVPAGRQVVVGRAALGSGAVVLVMSVDFLD